MIKVYNRSTDSVAVRRLKSGAFLILVEGDKGEDGLLLSEELAKCVWRMLGAIFEGSGDGNPYGW